MQRNIYNLNVRLFETTLQKDILFVGDQAKLFCRRVSKPRCHVTYDMSTSATVEALVSSDLRWEMGIRPERYLTPQ